MITLENPTARAEQRRRQMLREVRAAAYDVRRGDIVKLCNEIAKWGETRYLGRHPQWYIVRDFYCALSD